jgi:hypothetical protein
MLLIGKQYKILTNWGMAYLNTFLRAEPAKIKKIHILGQSMKHRSIQIENSKQGTNLHNHILSYNRKFKYFVVNFKLKGLQILSIGYPSTE